MRKKTQAHVICIKIPPINRKGARTEREIYNETLRHLPQDVTVVEVPQKLEKRSAQECLKDDLHLNREAAEEYAKAIEEAKTRRTEKQPSKRDQPTEIIKVPQKRIGQLIGRGGRNFEQMKAEYGVRIHVDEEEPANVRIAGEKAREAKEEMRRRIEDIIQSEERNIDRRRDRRDVECRYYAAGRCDKGQRCFFRHSREPIQDPMEGPSQRRERRESGSPAPKRRIIVLRE